MNGSSGTLVSWFIPVLLDAAAVCSYSDGVIPQSIQYYSDIK